MSKTFSRRAFVGISAAAGSTLALANVSMLGFLESDGAEAKVFQILKTHFGLNESHRGLAKKFCASLLSSVAHTENNAYFSEALGAKDLAEQLEKYVVQEFVVSTNYFEFSENPALSSLEMIV